MGTAGVCFLFCAIFRSNSSSVFCAICRSLEQTNPFPPLAIRSVTGLISNSQRVRNDLLGLLFPVPISARKTALPVALRATAPSRQPQCCPRRHRRQIGTVGANEEASSRWPQALTPTTATIVKLMRSVHHALAGLEMQMQPPESRDHAAGRIWKMRGEARSEPRWSSRA